MVKKRWLALVLLVLGVLIAVGVRSNPGHHDHADLCPMAQVEPHQPIDEEAIDDSLSTKHPALRAEYISAASKVLDREVMPQGAFIRIATFGGSIAGISTVCETSTRTNAAAPLLADARATGIKQGLAAALRRAADASVDRGSDIYAALVDAVQHVRSLQSEGGGAGQVYVWTDGDQAVRHVHLHRLLDHQSDTAIAKQIIGKQPTPDARGIAIEIHGIGRTGSNRPESTVVTRRTEHVWTLICEAMHALSCVATTDLA